MTPRRYARRAFLKTSALAATGALVHGCMTNREEPLVQIYHLPKRFSRRYGEFTANICGAIAPQVKQVKYQLNQDQWLKLGSGGPRVPPPNFVIELRARDLRRGMNHLKIEAIPNTGQAQMTSLQFEYDPSPIKLPIKLGWSSADLDVQDGRWETISVDGEWRVRPKPGTEDYDRILAVTGAFPGGRRIETSVTFRKADEKRAYGFGILPMWGGHPDNVGINPRLGWSFGITWFYSHYKGVGMEFSHKYGDTPPQWISSYRNFEIKKGIRYLVTVECWPESTENGRYPRYRQRMQWWAEGEQASNEWVELTSTRAVPLPPGEYAVALVAHRSQAEFGPTTVVPL